MEEKKKCDKNKALLLCVCLFSFLLRSSQTMFGFNSQSSYKPQTSPKSLSGLLQLKKQLLAIATKTTQTNFATTITNYIATCYTQNHVQNTQTNLCLQKLNLVTTQQKIRSNFWWLKIWLTYKKKKSKPKI